MISTFRGAWPAIAAAACLSLAVAASADEAPALGRYGIDKSRITISGISSGAYMANQVETAHSSLFSGVGLVAGGLYSCTATTIADGKVTKRPNDLELLSGPCMKGADRIQKRLPPDGFVSRITDFAGKDWIDPVTAVKQSKVFLFTGETDDTVNPLVVKEIFAVYQGLGVPDSQILLDDKHKAGHTWATLSYGNDCPVPSKSPYISKCGYDLSGTMLKFFYGDGLNSPGETDLSSLVAQVKPFSQLEFAPRDWLRSRGLSDNPLDSGLAPEGYVFVPEACKSAASACRLHVVLHGCKQSYDVVGSIFYANIGMLPWAAANDIVLLFPQAIKTSENPESCWNWWGYGGDRAYLFKDGVQITAITGMIKRIAGLDNGPH